MKRFAALLLVLLCLCPLAHGEELNQLKEWLDTDVAQPISDLFANETLVTATGTVPVDAPNDIALLSFEISAEGETVSEANQQVMAQIDAIRQILVEQGVPEQNIWHSRYDVSANVVYHNTRLTEEQVLDGYVVGMQLNVRLTDLKLVGVVIDAAMQSGAGSTHELQYEQSQAEQAYQAALSLAAQQAMDKAAALAESCGMTLGDLVSVTELSAVQDGEAKVEVSYRAK